MKPSKPAATTELRRRAEEQLRERKPAAATPESERGAQRLQSELQVYQIELEMQNEQLRSSQAEMEAAMARYTDLYDFAPAGYFTLQRNGSITQTNLAGARLLGLERSRLSGKRFGGFVARADQLTFDSLLEQIFEARPHRACELELVRKDLPPLSVHFEATLAPDGQECRAVVVDVSERKQVESTRDAFEAQLRVSQRMQSMGTLASGIAHDFNNILAAINGYAELARIDAGDNPAVLESLSEVATASKRAATLVRQILAFSRQEKQVRKTIQLGPVVEEALKLLRATLPASVTFRTALSPEVHPVLANATQIHQILMNLGTNAAHAMRNQMGRFEVTLENCTVDASLTKLAPDLRAGPHVRLSVSDTGHGMEPATAEQVFDPFFTTKGPGEGSGLGLSVVHGIVRSHQGAIIVRSQPGQGTTFELYFPAAIAATSESADGVTATTPIPRGQGERILFVDDEVPLGKLGKKTLERLGYVVDVESQPQRALDAVRAQPNAYALVVTDLSMPELLGTDLARELLLLNPDLPILLTSGYSAELTPASLHAIGIRELLLKPFSTEELGRAIHRALTTT